jgi:hypothetical protein
MSVMVLVSSVLDVIDMHTTFSLISTISQYLRPCLWQPGARASLMLGRASFSRTHPAAITRAGHEQDSEEAQAARRAQDRQYSKARLENETGEAREARLARQRQYSKAYLENETDEAREERRARQRQYQRDVYASATPEQR